jgi:hypothetical protein
MQFRICDFILVFSFLYSINSNIQNSLGFFIKRSIVTFKYACEGAEMGYIADVLHRVWSRGLVSMCAYIMQNFMYMLFRRPV